MCKEKGRCYVIILKLTPLVDRIFCVLCKGDGSKFLFAFCWCLFLIESRRAARDQSYGDCLRDVVCPTVCVVVFVFFVNGK